MFAPHPPFTTRHMHTLEKRSPQVKTTRLCWSISNYCISETELEEGEEGNR